MSVNKDLDDSINCKIDRRIFFISTAFAITGSALIGRLFYLQTSKSIKYSYMSDRNRLRVKFVSPSRGSILDQNRKVLAEDQVVYMVMYAKPKNCSAEPVLENLSKVANLPPIPQNTQKKMLKSSALNTPIVVHKNVNWSEVSKIEFYIDKLPGIYIAALSRRHYNFGSCIANLLGYTKNAYDGQNYYSSQGISGIEKALDEQLRGVPAVIQEERDAKMGVIKQKVLVPEIPGKTVRLTIDVEIQQFISEILAPFPGSAAIMNLENGNILALCSYPTYDNNKLSDGMPEDEWQKIINDKGYPMLNRPVATGVNPASVFKLVTALAALENNIINPDTTFECKGNLLVGDRLFKCWNKHGHGTVDLVQAITCSCNVFFYEIGMKIGVEPISRMASKLSLGKITNIGLKEEIPGVLPRPSWLKENLFYTWHIGDTVNIAMGQGIVSTTPIQLLTMVARIATGNSTLSPNIILNNQKPPRFSPISIQQEHLEIVRSGMYGAVNYPGGTAYKIFHHSNTHIPVIVAGKTGTPQSQKKSINHSSEKIAEKSHSIFAGYAPFENPKYAVLTALKDTTKTNRAAILASKIFSQLALNRL